MQKEDIFQILNDWNLWQKDLEIGVAREGYVAKCRQILDGNQILVITGPRRAGKSYIMRQLAEGLVKEGKAVKEQILIINFEDPRFVGLNVEILTEIFSAYLEFIRPPARPYVFLDEIQEVDGWEKWARTMHELGKAKIIISGSNAKLLSRELSTVLTGRHLDVNVWPLSFKEFLLFKSILAQNRTDYLANESAIKSGWREYMEFGGFPEVVKQTTGKTETLLRYFEDLVEKDLVRRYQVRKVDKIKELARFYFSNIAKPATNTSAGGFLELSADTTNKFAQYLNSVFLLYFVKRLSFKFKEQEKSPRKVYAVDVGLAKAVGFQFNDNFGRYLENAVYLELLRRQAERPGQELFYWKDVQHHEVDFAVKEKNKVARLIQVVWEMSEAKTQAREKKNLLKAMDEFGLKEGLIITGDVKGEEIIEGKKITILPIVEWLLF